MSDKPSLDIVLSKFFKKDVFNFMNQFPEEFESIVALTITDEKPICWRAAWVVQTFMEQDDERVQPYVDAILQIIPQKEDGHQRELLKLVINKNLTDEEEGRLFEVCIRIWKDIHKKPGTRSYAFQCIDNITTIYPELRNELMGLFGPEYLETLSPAIRKTILMKLKSADFNAVN